MGLCTPSLAPFPSFMLTFIFGTNCEPKQIRHWTDVIQDLHPFYIFGKKQKTKTKPNWTGGTFWSAVGCWNHMYKSHWYDGPTVLIFNVTWNHVWNIGLDSLLPLSLGSGKTSQDRDMFMHIHVGLCVWDTFKLPPHLAWNHSLQTCIYPWEQTVVRN